MAKGSHNNARRIKFPTGVVLWLDGEQRLQSEPTAYADAYRERHPHSVAAPAEPTDFERFVGELIDGSFRL